MMKHSNYFSYAVLLVLAIFVQSATLHAEESIAKTSRLFKFQHKLAMKGNTLAQYKLGCMYETGEGVALDVAQAKHWYEMAFKGGVKAAGDRHTYLTVKAQGYNQSTHSAWLDGVKTDAGASKGEAMFLLGQLFREGLGVKKDLNKSLELLERVSLLGDNDVEDEIALILDEIAENKEATSTKAEAKKVATKKVTAKKVATKKVKKKSQEKPVAEAARVMQVEKKQALKKPVKAKKAKQVKHKQKAQQKTKVAAKSEAQLQAEKIRRYEKAMMKLELEQRKIDQQQAWASGEEKGATDDEI